LKLNIEKIKWTNVETKCHEEYEKQPLKTLTNTTIYGYVPDVERRDLEIVDVDMHVVNDGDILIACNIIWYMGWWWKCFW
jgi:hypothetical protein